MAGLPRDPMILFSVLNMKLRDFYPSLDALCEDMDEDKANTTGVHWEWGQVGWQAGLRFWFKQFTVGAVYGRDFHDKSKLPRLHECSVTAGYCF